MDYEEVQRIMQTHYDNTHGKKGVLATVSPYIKRICNKTTLTNHGDDTYGLKLFSTEIITWCKDSVTLSDGGWFSRTTFDRFNTYLPRGFKVHGEAVPMKLGTVGVITTPAGTYPYALPMEFDNSGLQCWRGTEKAMYTNRALPALRALNDYVHTYLDALLARTLERYELEVSSKKIAELVLNGLCARGVLRLLQDNRDVDLDIVMALHAIGYRAIKKAKNATDRAWQAELTMKTGAVAPVTHKPVQTVRKELRRHLYAELLKTLGFETNEWNRR